MKVSNAFSDFDYLSNFNEASSRGSQDNRANRLKPIVARMLRKKFIDIAVRHPLRDQAETRRRELIVDAEKR